MERRLIVKAERQLRHPTDMFDGEERIAAVAHKSYSEDKQGLYGQFFFSSVHYIVHSAA